MASSQTSRNQTFVRVQEPVIPRLLVPFLQGREKNVQHTQAVHALERICANNDVGDGRAVLEDEYGAVTASVFI